MNNTSKYFLLFSLLTLLHIPCFAFDDSDSLLTDSLSKLPDTTIFNPHQTLKKYIEVSNPVNFEKRLRQNPTKALLKSMILPGLGQLGNKRYVKSFIYFGLYSWFLGARIHYGKQTSDFWEKFEQAESISLRNQYYGLFEDRKDERNKFGWFLVITTFVSMFDAYSDAHLSGFPVKVESSQIDFEDHHFLPDKLVLTFGIDI